MDIREARISSGITPKQFSEMFNIPIDTVKNWESGRRNPPKWAEALILEKLESMGGGHDGGKQGGEAG